MNLSRRLILGGVLILGIWGCAHDSGVTFQPPSANISEIRKSIASVIGEPRQMSENGRELYSQYFDERGLKLENPTKVTSRWYSITIVLGDRRPYDVNVDVIKETKDLSGNFYKESNDLDKASRLSKKIEKALHQGLEKRNIIDDFRAF